MTDAHAHVIVGSARHFLIGRDFFGTHPWEAEKYDAEALEKKLFENPEAGVGEIGLDQLKEKDISETMRFVFESQLKLAAKYQRPVVLHGAKCWGQVISAVKAIYHSSTPTHNSNLTFLCHGFSRSDGLIPEIEKLGGFISVGPAVLNDHAVNYREMVKKIPASILLLETDRTSEEGPTIEEVAAKTAELRGVSLEELETLTDNNARRFLCSM